VTLAAAPQSETELVNIGSRLSEMARQMPAAVAVVMPQGRDAAGKRLYDQMSFAQLDADSDHLAAGFQAMGITPGMRIALLVRPSIEFISLTFALFKAGAIIVLIDPGMGRKNMIRCLAESQPQGFVAIPVGQAVRTLFRGKFPQARFNVTVGRRWFWRGPTLESLRRRPRGDFSTVPTTAADSAAIIFTTGSTGPPKGVLYRHGNFDRQVVEIRDRYQIAPGEIDLPGFPLFGLFNAAMGVTTVIPDMDPTRPAEVDPRNIIEAVRDWKVTQAFGSPAIWNTVGCYCEEHQVKLPTLGRILSAGAPVPPHVLRRMKGAIADGGEIHTPYGATEALPVASISATEVLGETAAATEKGAGTCVGTPFPGINWRVIDIEDGPIENIGATKSMQAGQIGELIVQGAVVTTEYVTRTEANATAKIVDGDRFWHRMGDVGYLDEQGRFWFCGRKAHRLLTSAGPMYTIPCEAIVNCHQDIYRSALVGVGPRGEQRPVLIAEPWDGKFPATDVLREKLIGELLELAAGSELTHSVKTVLLHRSLPVDIRHNAKIFREKLAVWAEEELGACGG